MSEARFPIREQYSFAILLRTRLRRSKATKKPALEVQVCEGGFEPLRELFCISFDSAALRSG